MTTDHLIEIASVTKTMTAVAMMQLVEEGKVSLDDRVVKYPFHRWFNPTRITPEVRLRHVLSHTFQGPPGEVYCYAGNRFGSSWASSARPRSRTGRPSPVASSARSTWTARSRSRGSP